MTSASDVKRLRTDTGKVVKLAQRDLNRFWGTLDLSKPEAARDALLQFLPALVTTYGDIASTVAADWYETARAHQVGGLFNARTVEAATGSVAGSVRYAAGHLFTDQPMAMLPLLVGAAQRSITNASRATIRSNAQRDPARPRYARIPQGVTCAWCTLLSSRGFVYSSEESAGQFDEWHDHCDCQAVADWSDDPVIDGYDPGAAYDLYKSARASSGATDQKSIAAEMRRMFPDKFTDGVATSKT